MPSSEFNTIKTIVEKQLLMVMDFLLIDKQINYFDLRHISQFSLDKIDTSTNLEELHRSFNELVKNFPILSSHLHHVTNNLNHYLHA